MMNVLSLAAEEYRRWVKGKPDRFRTVNSFRPSGTDSSSTATATVNATPTTTAAPQTGQPQPGPSSVRSQSTIQFDPEVKEFRRKEDAFNYQRFSKYASETSKQRDTSKPAKADPLSNYDSIYQQDYRGLRGRPAMSARPPDHLKVSTCPFVPISEYQDQYRAWQILPSYERQDTYSRPTQRMDLQTSNAQDFKGRQGDVTASTRPPDHLRVGVSPSTEYQKEWLVPPPLRFKPEYVPPKGKIDFSTSYRQDFRAQERSMQFLMRPRDQIRISKDAFHNKTTYSSDFSSKSAWVL